LVAELRRQQEQVRAQGCDLLVEAETAQGEPETRDRVS
jgi:hypothetical protein